ncbi:hypothetical protein DV736_g3445, partial [Chaetothyriales sp. CBS 134916]
MAPKQKGGKKRADDWENELGEKLDPIAKATEDAKNAEAAQDAPAADAEDAEGGGLLAALRKNKNKRAKKGKIDNDFVEGEDPIQADSPAPEPADLSAKAPQEATFDDDDDFAGSSKKAESEKAVEAKVDATTTTADKEEKGGKKRKVPAHLAAIQKQQEALAKQREEQAREEAEAKAAEKERFQQQQLRMKQLLDSGAQVAGLGSDGAEDKKKKAGFEKKRKGPKKEEVDLEAAAERAPDSEIKDSWDADSDEDSPAPSKSTEESVPSVNSAARAVNDDAGKQTTDPKTLPIRDGDEVRTAAQRAEAQRKAEAAERRKQAHEAALAARSKDNLRSPICCILGHVDTGKTKLLDKIRQTNVQEGEAGGITQQIGATYFPVDALKQKIAPVNTDGKFDFKVPGLLVIDTPGHESFSNLRSRGSSLCNIAILVVDIMHGLEPQTLESMKLLRDRKTPFIVALNKIDRLYGWSKIDNNGFQDSLALQKKGVQNEFEDRLEKTKVAFAEQGFNAEVFYKNKNMARTVSLVPTSAHTGEGIPDMLKLLATLTQERMTSSLMYLSEVECTVLEVKVIEGLGTTIDVVLSNGVLREADRVVLCGLEGAITTNIRALLTPAPLKELRLKSQYVHNKEVKAALGVKIAAPDLDKAIAGSRLLVVGPDDDEEDLEEEVMADLQQLLTRVSKDRKGVSVQASTLGSLEALLEFLKQMKIPVANISIGPVYKRDVITTIAMKEKASEFAVMLCFDVKVDRDAQELADKEGIKIFTADIIYHLFDAFTKHMADINERKKQESKLDAVFPCVLKQLAVFNKKDPIVAGVEVIDGNLRPLTPICVIKTNPATKVKEILKLGRVTSIEREHKAVPICKKGQPAVAIKIEGPNQPIYGRQIEETDTLYSLISRKSIDVLKEFYRDEVTRDEWLLIKDLKPKFDIM